MRISTATTCEHMRAHACIFWRVNLSVDSLTISGRTAFATFVVDVGMGGDSKDVADGMICESDASDASN